METFMHGVLGIVVEDVDKTRDGRQVVTIHIGMRQSNGAYSIASLTLFGEGQEIKLGVGDRFSSSEIFKKIEEGRPFKDAFKEAE